MKVYLAPTQALNAELIFVAMLRGETFTELARSIAFSRQSESTLAPVAVTESLTLISIAAQSGRSISLPFIARSCCQP